MARVYYHPVYPGILVGGSAGQGLLLSNTERLAVARAFIVAADGRIAVIIHAGRETIP